MVESYDFTPRLDRTYASLLYKLSSCLVVVEGRFFFYKEKCVFLALLRGFIKNKRLAYSSTAWFLFWLPADPQEWLLCLHARWMQRMQRMQPGMLPELRFPAGTAGCNPALLLFASLLCFSASFFYKPSKSVDFSDINLGCLLT